MISARTKLFGLAAILGFMAPIVCSGPVALAGGKEAGHGPATGQPLPLQARLPAPGPEKGGLASLYPGDEGIERDPRVLFVEDFETGTLGEIGARWGNITKQENMGLAGDLHGSSPGTRSLRISDIGSLYTHTRGVDTMFKGGSVVDGGVSGSKAYSIPPGGANVWNAFSTPASDSTTVRFKVKPLGEANELQVMIWSKKHKDNCRHTIGGLKRNEWTQVEFRAIEARLGWAGNGPSLEGDVLDNLILLFQGKPADRILLDDVEILP